MWDSLSGVDRNKPTIDLDVNFGNSSNDAHEALQGNDVDISSFVPPMGFGRGRGRGSLGRGRGRGGRGPENMKGPDWECTSCTNINWSWRTTCNKCNSAKPASVYVS